MGKFFMLKNWCASSFIYKTLRCEGVWWSSLILPIWILQMWTCLIVWLVVIGGSSVCVLRSLQRGNRSGLSRFKVEIMILSFRFQLLVSIEYTISKLTSVFGWSFIYSWVKNAFWGWLNFKKSIQMDWYKTIKLPKRP